MQVKYVKINLDKLCKLICFYYLLPPVLNLHNLDKLCKLICFYYLLPPLVNLHNLDKNVSFTLG